MRQPFPFSLTSPLNIDKILCQKKNLHQKFIFVPNKTVENNVLFFLLFFANKKNQNVFVN